MRSLSFCLSLVLCTNGLPLRHGLPLDTLSPLPGGGGTPLARCTNPEDDLIIQRLRARGGAQERAAADQMFALLAARRGVQRAMLELDWKWRRRAVRRDRLAAAKATSESSTASTSQSSTASTSESSTCLLGCWEVAEEEIYV